MTLDETYDFLMQIRRKEIIIRRKETQRDELRACLLPGAIRYDRDRVQSTPTDILTVWVLPTMSRLRLPYTVFPIYRSSRRNFATRLAVQKFSSWMLRHGVLVQPVSIL